MQGNNLLVHALSGYSDIVYAAKSCEISVSAETTEIASPTTGQWKEYLVGRKEWSISCGYLVSDTKFDTDLLRVGNFVAISVNKRGSSTSLLGSAIVTQCSITATRGNLVQGSFIFKGNGELVGV